MGLIGSAGFDSVYQVIAQGVLNLGTGDPRPLKDQVKNLIAEGAWSGGVEVYSHGVIHMTTLQGSPAAGLKGVRLD